MEKTKYPQTLHLPFSLGKSSDDKTLKTVAHFVEKDVVVTRKMDGENFTGYPDGTSHARSIDSKYHPSRTWAKTHWAERSYRLNHGYRVCAENLYAKHSIYYDDLSTYLPIISVWDAGNVCLSWEDTEKWATVLNMDTVPVLYRGKWDEDLIRSLHDDNHEGYVVRLTESFHYDSFNDSVAKFVRANHVQTSKHWMHEAIVQNGLRHEEPTD